MSSPDQVDFSISEKALHAPHRHSRSAKHASQPMSKSASTASAEKSRKRGRPSGGHRRSELQEEVRYLLEESLHDTTMEEDDDVVSPSSAASYARNMLAGRDETTYAKEAQPSALQSRRESERIPMQKNEGRKRTCCSAEAMSVSPTPLYGELV